MKKRVLIIIFTIISILLAVYLGLAFFFKSHYLWNTTVGSIKCGGKTPAYVVEKNEKIAEDYLLTIYDRNNNKYHLKGLDLSYKYVPKGEEEKALEGQEVFKWPLLIFKEKQFDLSTSVAYDEAACDVNLSALEIFSENYIVKPENASISITDTGYEIVDEVMGCQPVYDKVREYVSLALNNQMATVTLDDACYVEPEVYANDSRITDAAARIDAYRQATIHYEIDGVDENLTSDMILKMLSIDENFNVNIDSEGVENFVQHLATTYNTYADVREFTTTKGDVIKIGGGDYGWVIRKHSSTDSKGNTLMGEYEQIVADLEAGQPVTREPCYEQRGVQSGLDDIGDTYVEIDYTNQHLWFYKDGQLITETDIVSGNLSRHNGSVDGVFKIVYKQKDATLVGEDYSSPVAYFMPFAYNIGIHDASSWRSQYGGEIYKTSGSHGCINVPLSAAETIYNNIEVGTPVVAYYREKVKLTNYAAEKSNAYSYDREEAEKLKEGN